MANFSSDLSPKRKALDYSLNELNVAFKDLDVNGDGFIDPHDLQIALSGAGQTYTIEEVRR